MCHQQTIATFAFWSYKLSNNLQHRVSLSKKFSKKMKSKVHVGVWTHMRSLDLGLLQVVEKKFFRVWGKQKARNVKVHEDFQSSKWWFRKTTQYQQTPSTTEISFGGGGGAWKGKQLSGGGEYCDWRKTALKKATISSNSREWETIVAPPEFNPTLNTETW